MNEGEKPTGYVVVLTDRNKLAHDLGECFPDRPGKRYVNPVHVTTVRGSKVIETEGIAFPVRDPSHVRPASQKEVDAFRSGSPVTR